MSNYRDLMSIARAVVRSSAGCGGYGAFDEQKIILFVGRAGRMAALSDRCKNLFSEVGLAQQRLRAAQTLGLDASPYQKELDRVTAEYDRVSEKVDAVVSNYRKDYYGNWQVTLDEPVVI